VRNRASSPTKLSKLALESNPDGKGPEETAGTQSGRGTRPADERVPATAAFDLPNTGEELVAGPTLGL